MVARWLSGVYIWQTYSQYCAKREKAESIFIHISKKISSFSTLLFDIVLEIVVRAIKQEKEIKTNGKERIQFVSICGCYNFILQRSQRRLCLTRKSLNMIKHFQQYLGIQTKHTDTHILELRYSTPEKYYPINNWANELHIQLKRKCKWPINIWKGIQ